MHDALQVADGEVQIDAPTLQVGDRRGLDDEHESVQQPVPSQHGGVHVTVRQTQMTPHLFGDAMQVPVEEGLVGPGVRRPELDPGAVLADAPDLAEDVVRLLDVLEEMGRVHLIDGGVVEGVAVRREVENMVDLLRGKEVEPHEPGPLGVAAPQIHSYGLAHRVIPRLGGGDPVSVQAA